MWIACAMLVAGVDVLDPKAEKAVRDLVCDFGVATYLADVGVDAVALPQAMKDAYAEQPRATIKLLLRMAASEKPVDSNSACAYALALLSGPTYGALCDASYERQAKVYDDIPPKSSLSPRQFWIGAVRAEWDAAVARKMEPRSTKPDDLQAFTDTLRSLGGKK